MNKELLEKIQNAIFLPPDVRQKWLTFFENNELNDEATHIMEQLFRAYEENVHELMEKTISKEAYEVFKRDVKKILSGVNASNEHDEHMIDMKKIEEELNNL